VKIRSVFGAEYGIEEEHPAEEEEFGEEEDPHPHLGAGITDPVSGGYFVRMQVNHIYTARV